MDKSQMFAESRDWDGTVKSGVYKESKNGTPYIEVTFDVAGHMKNVPFYLSDKAMDSSLVRLKELGWNGDVNDVQFSRTEPVKLECKHELYNDKLSEKWQYWGAPKQYKADALKANTITGKYKSIVSMTPPPAPTTKMPPPPSKPSTPPPPSSLTSMGPPPTMDIPKPAQIASTMEEAWAYYCKQCGSVEKATERWQSTLEANGRLPNNPEEWNKFAHAVDVPF